MKKIVCTVLLNLLLITGVSAKTVTVSREASGFGADYQQALAAALLEAVRQVRGLEIGTEKQLQLEFQQLAKGSVETTTAKAGVKEDIYTRSKGWIDGYEIIEVVQPDEDQGIWKVSVRASIPDYQSEMKNDTRKSIAIVPFRFSKTTFAVAERGKKIDAYPLSVRLQDRIQSEFTQTRKFAVVNRDYEAAFASEKKLLSSDSVPAGEASRLGQTLGADFMLVGNIFDLSTTVEEKAFYGMNRTKVLDHIDLSYQVIEVATQKIMWADTLTEKIARLDEASPVAVLDRVANLVVSEVMGVIYPVKVMELSSRNEIYLNQGGDRVAAGDRFKLFTKGRTLTDPDTGMPIKIDGQQVGVLSVVTVMPKYSIAELVEGDYGKVEKGAILRLYRPKISLERAPAAKTVRPTAGSGDAPIRW